MRLTHVAPIFLAGCLITCVQITADQQTTKPADLDAPVLTKQERIFGLVTVYRTAKQHFAYFEQVPDLDWDQEFMSFLPLVEKEQSLLEYYRVLQRFAALLQDGHSQVYLPNSLRNQLDRLPLRLEIVEGQWVVTERYPVKEILGEDIPPGSVVTAIEGQAPWRFFREHVFPYIAAGREESKIKNMHWTMSFPKNSQVRFALRYPDGSEHSRIIRANRRTADLSSKAVLENYLLAYHRPPDFVSEKLPGDVLYVRYGKCNDHCKNEFSKLMFLSKLNPPKTMILDLRGNGGGSTPMDTVQRLISKPIKWYQYKTRWSASYIDAQLQLNMKKGVSAETAFERHWLRPQLPSSLSAGWYKIHDDQQMIQPHIVHYDGPLVILVDGDTGSAAEGLVVLLQGNGRGTVIGETSAGSTGQPFFFDLPGGGRVRICTVNERYPDGKEFVGPGMQPDIPVKRTIRGITAGRDEVLEATLELIRAGKLKNGE